MILLQEGIIGGPMLIAGALIALLALGLLIVFVISLTKTPGAKEDLEEGEQKDDPDDNSAKKAKRTDRIILIIIMAAVAFFLIKFLYWLGNIKFD